MPIKGMNYDHTKDSLMTYTFPDNEEDTYKPELDVFRITRKSPPKTQQTKEKHD